MPHSPPPSSTSPSPSRQRTSTFDRERPSISEMAYLNHGVTSSRRGRHSGRHEMNNVARNIVAFKPLTRSDKAVDTGSHSPSVEPSWTHVRRSPDSLELPPTWAVNFDRFTTTSAARSPDVSPPQTFAAQVWSGPRPPTWRIISNPRTLQRIHRGSGLTLLPRLIDHILCSDCSTPFAGNLTQCCALYASDGRILGSQSTGCSRICAGEPIRVPFTIVEY